MNRTQVASRAAALVLSSLLATCGNPRAPEAAIEAAGLNRSVEAALPVRVDTVRQGDLVVEVSATGQVTPWRRTAIAAEVAGRVAEIPHGEGSRVAAGDVLLRLDSREHVLAVREAEAELAEARSRFRELTLGDERIEDPSARQARAEAVRVRSGLGRAEVALERARYELDRTTVRAPYAGFVSGVRAGPGELVGAGQETLVLVDLRPVRVEVQVPEGELRWLAVGAPARVRIPALPDEERTGTVVTIDPVIEPESRTGRVTVSVPNAAGTIRPGMYARVTLPGRRFADRTRVPREALIERDGRTLVFVFQPLAGDPGVGTAGWVYVTPGVSTARDVELVTTEETPIPALGTPVLVAGHHSLVHDARVRDVGP